MERIGNLTGRALNRNSIPTTTQTTKPLPACAPESDAWQCPRCGASWPSGGWRRWFAPFGSRLVVEGCEGCLYRDLTQPEVRANTIAAYGLDNGRFADMTLEGYKPLTAKERDALAAAQLVAESWRNGGGRSLWLWANLCEPPTKRAFGKQQLTVTGCGNGKTHIAVALAKLALDMGRSVKIVAENELLDEIKASYDENAAESEAQIVADLGQPWLLVMDDVGAKAVKSQGWYQGILYGIVDRRYRERKPLVLTSNLAPDELAERLGTRTISRLSEMGVGVNLDGPDRRLMR